MPPFVFVCALCCCRLRLSLTTTVPKTEKKADSQVIYSVFVYFGCACVHLPIRWQCSLLVSFRWGCFLRAVKCSGSPQFFADWLSPFAGWSYSHMSLFLTRQLSFILQYFILHLFFRRTLSHNHQRPSLERFASWSLSKNICSLRYPH